MSTHQIKLPSIADEDDDAILNELARKAVGAILAGFLALTLASVGALAYVLVTDRAAAGEGVRLEVLGGQCQGKEKEPGNWYHPDYRPYELDLRSNCFQVSISQLIGKWRGWDTGARFGYADLGAMHINAIWWLRDADFDRRPDGNSCDPRTFKDCLGAGHLRQRVYGFTAGGLLERDLASWLRMGLEGGLFVYKGSFDIWVKSYPRAGLYDDWHAYFGGLQLSPYLGVTMNSGYFMLSTRVYGSIRAAEHGCGGCSGATKGPATQITAGLSVPF